MEQSFFFSVVEAYMIDLLRYGVWDKRPDIILPSSDVDWDKLMDIASSQGLLAWVWDGICKLPKESQPPRQKAISWGLSAQEIWERYNHQKQVLMQIIDVCKKNDIRLLLFKGIALSELYPRPESRPSSDIDFYLFDDYELGDKLFAKQNVTRTNKRTGFDYQGVHIENHRIFLNTYTKMQVNAIKYLEESLSDVSLTKDGYYIMSPIASVVYQVMHFVAHLDDVSNPLSLRFIVDFGITLYKYQDQISNEVLKSVLERLKIKKVFGLMLKLVEEILNMEFKRFRYMEIDLRDTRAVISLMRNRPSTFVPLIERNFVDRVKFYKIQYKRYDRLYKYFPQSKIMHVLSSICELFSISVRRILHIPNDITYPEYIKKIINSF